MDDFILISNLNDFTFCPYSIYLHNIYKETDEDLYYSPALLKGKLSHATIDEKTASNKKDDLQSLPVISLRLGIMGNIDIYRSKEKLLIERKYNLKTIYRGQLYQLWAQYFCMKEMGYEVEKLAFYEISTNKTTFVELPTKEDRTELEKLIEDFRNYDLETEFPLNENKCKYCVYCNLCDKTNIENVYT
ncbi:MAG: type V CRISPR-associated protein Cas4 [Bacteroidales bacterium]|nr:type V CRISPR-associated protein Cas4 [Bacteroidales bacterium]